MFPSDNNKSTTDLENPLETNPIFFSNFPSPFLDEELPLNQILHSTPRPENKPDPNPGPDPAKKLKSKANDRRKRTGKKDRHSKICTAQGIRDRRMRLSLQVARKFFDLQDILGYDKASCTIEWLFSKSNTAIRELITQKKQNINNNNNLNFSESYSECEVVSGVHEVSSKEEVLNNTKRKVVQVQPRSTREAREKARARARWRTKEKMMIRRRLQIMNNSSQLFSSPNCYHQTENVEDPQQRLGFSAEYHDAGTIEKLLGNSGFSISNYDCPDENVYESYCKDGFLGNWQVLGNNNNNVDRIFDCSVTNEGSSMASNVSPGSAQNFLFFHQ